MLNYLTSFSPNDIGLIAGIIAGCALGYGSSGLLDCGLDKVVSIAGGISATSLTSKLTNKHSLNEKFNLPKPPKKSIEWIKKNLRHRRKSCLLSYFQLIFQQFRYGPLERNWKTYKSLFVC